MSLRDLSNQQVTVTLNAHQQYFGVVRKVGRDFLLIDDEAIGTVIVPLEHMKQLRLGNLHQALSPTRMRMVRVGPGFSEVIPDTFLEVLSLLNQSVVNLEGGGSNPTTGYLLDVKADYLVTTVIPDGIIFFPVRHITSLQPMDVSVLPEFESWVSSQRVTLPIGERFLDLLQQETGRMVKFGRGGPEDISGILRSADESFIEIVVSPHETVCIPTHHVKAFSRIEMLASWNWTQEASNS